jgi:hypothetical protein
MNRFDETYADADFQQQLADAHRGWMAQVPKPEHPDLDVDGLSGSLLKRLLRAIKDRGR